MREKLRLALLFGVLGYSLIGLLVWVALFDADDDSAALLLGLVGFAGFPLVGLIVLIRRPGNRIGRLLMATCAFVATASFLYAVARWTAIPLQIRTWAELIAEQFWYLLFGAVGSLVILFPTGAPSNRLDRLTLVTLHSLLVVVILGTLLRPTVLPVTLQPNPLGLEAARAIGDWLYSDDSFVLFLGTMLFAMIGVILRWRASEGVKRLQFRVFGAGAALFLGGLLVSTFVPDSSSVGDIGFVIALLAIPLSIGAAILRYRLFDIDRIISRTAAYTVLAAVLAAVYVISVTLTQRVIPIESQVGVVISTLIVAALFNPLRRRLQTEVDRRFNRSRYVARRVLEEFSARLRDDVDLELLQAALLSAAQDTLQPSHLTLWVRLPPSGETP